MIGRKRVLLCLEDWGKSFPEVSPERVGKLGLMGHPARLKTESSFQIESRTFKRRKHLCKWNTSSSFWRGALFFASWYSSWLYNQNEEPYYSSCLQQCRCLYSWFRGSSLKQWMTRWQTLSLIYSRAYPAFTSNGAVLVWAQHGCSFLMWASLVLHFLPIRRFHRPDLCWTRGCTLAFPPSMQLFLLQQQQGQQRGASDISFTIDANKQQRQLIAELENKNR